MLPRSFALLTLFALAVPAFAADERNEKAIRKAVTFYASFDDEVKGDVGGGQLTFDTRITDKGKVSFEKGFSDKAFRIAKDKGIAGGALEAVDVLPNNGRIFVPVKGNLAYKPDGWSGSVSMWCKTDPDTMLKTKFCDPVQITQKGSGNGGLWFDFNDAKPRDLRHGAFTMIPEGKKGIGEDDPNAPMVRVPKIGWKKDEWHHVVMTFENLDTGKDNAVTSLYIDGKLIGQVEMACFDRALKPEEVAALHKRPGMLSELKKPAKKEPLPVSAPAAATPTRRTSVTATSVFAWQ